MTIQEIEEIYNKLAFMLSYGFIVKIEEDIIKNPDLQIDWDNITTKIDYKRQINTFGNKMNETYGAYMIIPYSNGTSIGNAIDYIHSEAYKIVNYYLQPEVLQKRIIKNIHYMNESFEWLRKTKGKMTAYVK